MKIKTKIILRFVLFFILLVGVTIICWNPFIQLFSNAEDIQTFVKGFGILAPIAFISIVIFQVLLAPIPGQVTGLAGGYIFGAFLGTLYSLIGLTIGSFVIFCLARKLGRKFVEKIVKKKTLNKFDRLIKKKGVPMLFLIYLLPLLPDDLVCYIAGLTKIKIKTLVIISTLGRFPGILILSLVGAGLASENMIFSAILFIVMMFVSIAIYLNRNKLEKTIIKIIGVKSK